MNHGTLSVISTATNAVLATIPLGTAPNGIAVSPDGSELYVADYITNVVSVVSATTNAVVGTIPAAAPYDYIALAPNGGTLYFANNSAGTVSVASTTSNTVTATIPVGLYPVGAAITPDGSEVYVTNNGNGVSNGTVSVISTATNSVVATVPVGGGTWGVFVQPRGTVGIPVVTGVAPTSGPAIGGTPVTVSGSGFTGATAVSFGGALATNVQILGDTQLTAVSPANTGTVDVTVSSPLGTSAASPADQFSYAPPVVTGVAPSNGSAAGGTLVTVTGSGFTSATGVTFGKTPATNVQVSSDTQLTAVSPAGTGKVDVTVIEPGASSATSPADRFSYLPTVTALSPTFGPATGGTSVSVTGTGFTGATRVSFGKTPATNVQVSSDTQLTALSPAGTGRVDVTVAAPGGVSPTSAADRFVYGVPTTVVLATSRTPAIAGDTVTFTATVNPADGSQIADGAEELVTFTEGTTTLCPDVPLQLGQATCDANTLEPGSEIITAAYSGDGTYQSSSGTVKQSILYATASSLNPNFTLSMAYGAKATVQATVGVRSGTPGSQGAATPTGSVSFIATNTLSILGTSKLNSSGVASLNLSKVNAGGYVVEAFYSGNQQYGTSTSAPLLVSISSVNTAVAVTSSTQTPTENKPVTLTATVISGTGAVPVGTVTFTYGSITLGTATLGKGQAHISTASLPVGQDTVQVSYTPTSSNFGPSNGTLTLTTYAKPVVAGVAPANGPAAGGTSVTLTGTGFTGATAVKFGGAAATNLQVISDTQVTAVSPAGSGQVNVAVTTPGGTSATSTTTKFTYQ